jgi:hypothetical protein
LRAFSPVCAPLRMLGNSVLTCCAELRCFAAKNFQTVEKTVKSLGVSRLPRARVELFTLLRQ